MKEDALELGVKPPPLFDASELKGAYDSWKSLHGLTRRVQAFVNRRGVSDSVVVYDRSGLNGWALSPDGDQTIVDVRTDEERLCLLSVPFPTWQCRVRVAVDDGQVPFCASGEFGVLSAQPSTQKVELEVLHPIPEFDGRCVLMDDGSGMHDGKEIHYNHTYLIDGGYSDKRVSPTSLIHRFLEGFDAVKDEMIPRVLRSRGLPDKHYYGAFVERLKGELADTISDDAVTSFLAGECDFQSLLARVDPNVSSEVFAIAKRVLSETWEANGQAQAALGTEMHQTLEDYGLGKRTRASVEIEGLDEDKPELLHACTFLDTWLKGRDLVPFRMELCVFDQPMGDTPALDMAGMIDSLFINEKTGELVMIDWKRAKMLQGPLNKEAPCRPVRKPNAQGRLVTEPLYDYTQQKFTTRTSFSLGTGPLSDLVDCDLTKYFLQQNLYRWFLAKNGGNLIRTKEGDIKLAMYLAVFNPAQEETFSVIPVPEMPEHTLALLNARREELGHPLRSNLL